MTQLEEYITKIKKKIEPCYFIIDETGFFFEEILLNLKSIFLGKSAAKDSYAVFHVPDFNLDEILEALRTVSLFSPKRLCVFKNADQLNADQVERLTGFLKNGFQDICLLFFSQKKTKNKLFKYCAERGTGFEFKKPYESKMSYWVQWIAKKEKKNIGPKAVKLLLGKTQDLFQLAREIEKLSLYSAESEEITEADIQGLLYSTRQHSIFELTDAIGYQKKQVALTVLQRLLNEGEAEVFIFSMIMRHLRNIWKAVSWKETKSDSEAQFLLGVHPMFWDDFRKQRDHFEKAPFEAYWALASQTDKALKSLSIDKRSILTRFVYSVVIPSA